VSAVQADILRLQEVTRAPQASPDWLTHADAERRLDQHSDLFGDVSGLMRGHQAQFCAAMRGTLTDHDGQSWPSEHGSAVWLRRDLAIVAQIQGFAHGSFRADGRGDPPASRAIQALRIIDPATGGAVVVCHLHGLRAPAGKGDNPERAAQAQAMVAAVAAVRQDGDGVILAGDPNLQPDSDTFGVLAGIGLTDLVTTRGHSDTRTSLYAKPARHGDYLLVSAGVQVRRFDVPALPGMSDHRPLVLDLDL